MFKFLDRVVTIIVGTISSAARGVTNISSSLEDFLYVKIYGLSFVVLGARQTGKTTLIEWLKHNMELLEGFNPDPTAAGGDVVPDFSAPVDDDKYIKLKPNRDVGGEYAMWETDWIELFRQAQPRGILFLIDHTDVSLHKDALNFVLQMIDDEPSARKNLKAFFVLVNKSDLWRDQHTLDEIVQNYRNEHKRMRSQAQRVGYRFAFAEGSLLTGVGVRLTMKKFFNLIRPKVKEEA
jgi:GTPase SAR1 family protein